MRGDVNVERVETERIGREICRVAAAVFLAGVVWSGQLAATELVRDDFEDGIVDPTLFTPIGGATLVETGGKLFVTVRDQDQGIRIAAPPGAMSFVITQEINQPEFDIGESLTFRALIMDPDNGKEFPLLESRMLRPFWNFCVYDIKQGSNSSTIGIFCKRGLTSKDGCPAAKDLRLDWLPPLPGETQDRLVYQVRGKNGKWRFGKSRNSDLVHKNGDLTGYTITFKDIDPRFSDR